jgi:hypothetical protein
MLDRTEAEADLQDLQRSTLLPLELRVLSHRVPAPGPEALTRLTLACLEDRRRHHD